MSFIYDAEFIVKNHTVAFACGGCTIYAKRIRVQINLNENSNFQISFIVGGCCVGNGALHGSDKYIAIVYYI